MAAVGAASPSTWFNHPRFGAPNTDPSSSSFGRVTPSQQSGLTCTKDYKVVRFACQTAQQGRRESWSAVERGERLVRIGEEDALPVGSLLCDVVGLSR
jgi:hypothetical protein